MVKYYDENTWSFTKLGHLNGAEDEIREVFGGNDEANMFRILTELKDENRNCF